MGTTTRFVGVTRKGLDGAAVQPPLRALHAASLEFDSLSDSAFIRMPQVLAVVPISKASVWRLCAQGDFVAPTKLSPRVTAWKVGKIREWLMSREARPA